MFCDAARIWRTRLGGVQYTSKKWHGATAQQGNLSIPAWASGSQDRVDRKFSQSLVRLIWEPVFSDHRPSTKLDIVEAWCRRPEHFHENVSFCDDAGLQTKLCEILWKKQERASWWQERKYPIVSMFSGVGGLDLAWSRLGHLFSNCSKDCPKHVFQLAFVPPLVSSLATTACSLKPRPQQDHCLKSQLVQLVQEVLVLDVRCEKVNVIFHSKCHNYITSIEVWRKLYNFASLLQLYSN